MATGLLEQARAHLQAGRLNDAIRAARAALAESPDDSEAMLLTARILRRTGRYDIAAPMYDAILAHFPDSAEGHAGLGACYGAVRRYTDAIPALEQAVALDPDYFEAWCFLGEALIEQGKTTAAIDCFEKSLAIAPYNHVAISKYLFHIAFDPRFDAKRIFDLNRDWGRHVESVDRVLDVTRPVRTGARIRLGYLSDEFRQGVTSRFMESVLAHHDRDAFEIFCYARNAESDDATELLSGHGDTWRNLSGLSDAEAAGAIRRDAIDILVLCTSYRAESRVVMAYRPAPVQVCYNNMVSTTGLAAVDYKVTEALTDDPAWYVEKLVQLSRANVYKPPAPIAPSVTPPCFAAGRITFCSFNNPGKVTPETVAVWSKIINAVPESRLVMKSSYRFADSGTRQYFESLFARHGIGGERLVLMQGDSDLAGHLERYRMVDIALDPFPCNGGTTSCEALWMGVPVISMSGETFMNRQGLAYLSRLGLGDLVAQSAEEYVAIASGLALDTERLAYLRATLRSLSEERLLDGIGHTRELECAYREMWRRHVAGEAPAGFAVSGQSVTVAGE
ncbi:MAG: tetratricopeptide repeat protein [Alphaproteobacteria bacterium]